MSLHIIKAGILDSIQDGGRYGYQERGINPSGAMDRYALQEANVLLGNDPGEAGIELHFPASVIRFTQPLVLALTGADFGPRINDTPVPLRQCIVVNEGDVLHFSRLNKGARAYLSVKDGFGLEKWLGSMSTHLRASAGGYHGRRLQKGDLLPLNTKRDYGALVQEDSFTVLPWKAPDKEGLTSSEIHVLKGHEWDRLTTEGKTRFREQEFTISRQADRMGYRLEGEALASIPADELLSSAVSFGTIQLLPDGKLIVLMADHQTTGGYPRPGHVITADHGKLAQKQPGEKLYFRLTEMTFAEELLYLQEQALRRLQQECLTNWAKYG